MAWKPKLATVAEQVKQGPRPWVAIAEEAAPEAVRLFVSIMKDPKKSDKLRMEAATRLVMIAGATFRGEKLDGQGRPAANLPGRQVQRLESSALKEVLRQLPPGSVTVHPQHVQAGETVVVMQDTNESRTHTGKIVQAAIGKVFEQPEDSPPVVTPEERDTATKGFLEKKPMFRGKEKNTEPTGQVMDVLKNLLG